MGRSKQTPTRCGNEHVHQATTAAPLENGRQRAAATLSQRLESLLASPDAAAGRRLKHKRKRPRHSTKKVYFHTTKIITQIISPQEVGVEESSDADEQQRSIWVQQHYYGLNETALYQNQQQQQPLRQQKQFPLIQLASYTLEKTVLQMVDDDAERCTGNEGAKLQPSNDSERVRIYTVQGVVALLKQCWTNPAEDAKDENEYKALVVGQAVAHETLECHLTKVSSTVAQVSFFLSPRVALDVVGGDEKSNSVALLSTVRKKTKAHLSPRMALSRALGILVPKLDFFGTPDTAQRVVTAQQIYSLVDNEQYHGYRQQLQQHSDQEKSLVIPGLLPTLRPYQTAAVRWMIERETGHSLSRNKEWELLWIVWNVPAITQGNPISCGWDVSPLYELGHEQHNDDTHIFYCPFAGWWAETYQQAQDLSTDVNTVSRGGILAESMGLGKTVEVLACILAHRATTTGTATTADSAVSGLPETTTEPVDVIPKLSPTVETEDPSEKARMVASSTAKSSHSHSKTDEVSDGEFEFDMTVEDGSSRPSAMSLREERFLRHQSEALGVCICGQPIHLDERLPVVVCDTCQEPMHADCANVETARDLGDKKIVVYQFGKLTLECQVCENAHCPCCVGMEETKISSRATVIVTPAAILNQWQREIQRHTAIRLEGDETTVGSPLKVIVYPGIRNLCNQRGKKDLVNKCSLIHPQQLADADVVLMTFDSLMGDLGHSDDNPFAGSHGGTNGRLLRQRKMYRVVPSPLLAIEWWRVCLDEAQRVQTPTALSAKMALKLNARHRWCISGTPIGRGKLEDLYGLLLFLRLEPFNRNEWFAPCFRAHHEGLNGRIKRLLKDVMWRSTKESPFVKEEMGVPEQIEKKVYLKFSSIERHFYQRQLEATINAVGDVANNEKEGKRQASSMDGISTHLHKLRAACCHPQVGSGGLARTKRKKLNAKRSQGVPMTNEVESSPFSRILTMDQILDRLIDDAKLKCEEAQRLCLMHNNAMAAISKLKVQAKERGFQVSQGDTQLMIQSCKLYLESLKLIDENSTPSCVIGEAVMSGSIGFRSPREIFANGNATLGWKLMRFDDEERTEAPHLWSRFDFEGPAKRISQIKIRPLNQVPQSLVDESEGNIAWRLLKPKTCVFQVASPAVEGEFVDVATIELPRKPDNHECVSEWVSSKAFRSTRSKSFRLVMRSYHDSSISLASRSNYCGVELQMLEPYIGGDSLQRMHCLHNGAMAFKTLLDIQGQESQGTHFMSDSEMKSRVETMASESQVIQQQYLDGVIPTHNEAQRLLRIAVSERERLENSLLEMTKSTGRIHSKDPVDYFNDEWWNDLLSACHRYGSPRDQHELCKRVHEDLNSAMEGAYDRKELKMKPFPQFHDVNGLYQALALRTQDLRDSIPQGAVGSAIKKFMDFSISPSEAAILESSTCERCKKDWTWTGPMCGHCRLSVQFNQLVPDRLFLLAIGSIHAWMKGGKSSGSFADARASALVDDRARKFFEVGEAIKREKSAAERAWRVHLDLLNDLDELNMCKQAMRLTQEGEDLSRFTEAELNAVVHPLDVGTAYHDHGAKQAMALANLRRHNSTLRYLRNQKVENNDSPDGSSQSTKDSEEVKCVLCLSSFRGSRAVLVCGHSFHYSPCMEQLMNQSGNRTAITCPLRCVARTKVDDIMMATDKRRDNGSSVNRQIKGSWGTKVTRLTADIMDVSDCGEKSVVFSMWDSMLDVVEEALLSNGVSFVRATSLAKISECTKRFRSSDCSVLLLNVKNGAEGLTLLEATHVFMVEPLLNAGLDLQAINRIHRIGQTQKTYVHRYLIQDTIEMKIDTLRRENQGGTIEDEMIRSKKQAFNAGGIDGGFSSAEELLTVLRVD